MRFMSVFLYYFFKFAPSMEIHTFNTKDKPPNIPNLHCLHLVLFQGLKYNQVKSIYISCSAEAKTLYEV